MSNINDTNSIYYPESNKEVNLTKKISYKEKMLMSSIARKIFLVGIAGIIITQMPLVAAACSGPINQIPFLETRTNKLCNTFNIIRRNLLSKETGIFIGSAIASSIVSTLITRMVLLNWSDHIMNDQQSTIEDLSIELYHCYQQSKK